jgi:hypothetical protein
MNPSVTTIVINDPELLAKLAAASGQIIFQSPAGQPIQTVETVAVGKLPPGMKSPFTDEEIERARKEPDSGVTLDEFWKLVQRGEWK